MWKYREMGDQLMEWIVSVSEGIQDYQVEGMQSEWWRRDSERRETVLM